MSQYIQYIYIMRFVVALDRFFIGPFTDPNVLFETKEKVTRIIDALPEHERNRYSVETTSSIPKDHTLIPPEDFEDLESLNRKPQRAA